MIATTLVVGILIGAPFFGGRRVGGDVSRSSNKFKEILTYINRSYVDSVNTDSLADYSITKMLEKLGCFGQGKGRNIREPKYIGKYSAAASG